MVHTRYALSGTAYLLHRIGWSVQVPRTPGGQARRGGDRDLAAGDVADGKTVTAHRDGITGLPVGGKLKPANPERRRSSRCCHG
jgi:hypothetical protein